MKINGLEANFLLYCIDAYCGVNEQGKLLKAKIPGYSLKSLQKLRDRMFAIHDHPEKYKRNDG
jgi:hypothetical protein